jgi:hypothetical protein
VQKCTDACVHLIREITLSSQGRPISILNTQALLATVGSVPWVTWEVRQSYVEGMGLKAGGLTDAVRKEIFLLDLPFMFRTLKYSYLTSFVQPLQISVSRLTNTAPRVRCLGLVRG